MSALLWISYPLLVHAAVLTGRSELQAAALGWLVILLLLPAMRTGNRKAWAAAAAGVTLAAMAPAFGLALVFLYIPPIAINLMLFGVFSHSLRADRTPVVTATARAIRGELSPTLVDYTRKVTWMWSGLFLLMAALSLGLAVFASAVMWSTFTNFLNYVIVGCVFIGEFLMRRWLLPQEKHTGVIAYIRGLLQADFRNPGA